MFAGADERRINIMMFCLPFCTLNQLQPISFLKSFQYAMAMYWPKCIINIPFNRRSHSHVYNDHFMDKVPMTSLKPFNSFEREKKEWNLKKKRRELSIEKSTLNVIRVFYIFNTMFWNLIGKPGIFKKLTGFNEKVNCIILRRFVLEQPLKIFKNQIWRRSAAFKKWIKFTSNQIFI